MGIIIEMDKDRKDRATEGNGAGGQDLEESLMDSVKEDGRLTSGTHAADSDNVLDFIQMSGLTTARGAEDAGTDSFEGHATTPDSLSFYEAGVGDVDALLDPLIEALAETVPSDTANPPTSSDSGSVAGLQQIIADLAGIAENREETATPDLAAETPDLPVSTPEPESAASLREDPDPLEPEQAVSTEIDETSTVLPALDEVIEWAGSALSNIEDSTRRAALQGVPANPAQDLEEARGLLEKLESAPPTDRPSPLGPAPVPHDSEPPRDAPSPAWVDDAAESEEDAWVAPTRHRRRRRGSRLGRWLTLGASIVALAGVVFGGVQVFINQTEAPRSVFASAQTQFDEGKYLEASNAFLDFTRRFPEANLSPEAMFMAGNALQLSRPETEAAAQETYFKAIALLERFVTEYPNHAKVARVETLIGLLHYRTGGYLEAVSILGRPDRRLRDPGAYLTCLRTLGRSYAALSQIESARTAFMRAALLDENMAADEDYVELGSFYQQLAEQSRTIEDRIKYEQLAVEQWDYALRVPGLLRSRREDIKLRREVIAGRLEAESVDADGVSVARPSRGRASAAQMGERDRSEVPARPRDETDSRRPIGNG